MVPSLREEKESDQIPVTEREFWLRLILATMKDDFDVSEFFFYGDSSP
jgi:hypothetical protein